jgi:hypothetical protein
MRDLEDLVREQLHREGEVFGVSRAGPRAIPGPVQRRIRRRQVATVGLGAVAVAVIAAGAVALASFLPGVIGEQRPTGSSEPVVRVTDLDVAPMIHSEDWRGKWPEVTEPAGRMAQQAARDPASGTAWRLSPVDTAERYARDVFGWEEVEGRGLEADLQESPANVRISCPACPGEPQADIELHRLVQEGPTGVWFVTGLTVPDTRAGAELADLAVAELLRARAGAVTSLFLQYRITGDELAEVFLGPEAAEAYASHRSGLYLYGHPTDEPDAPGRPEGHPELAYGGFDIVQGPEPVGEGAFETLISIDATPADQPFVGPSQALPEQLRIEPRAGRLQIVSARPATLPGG